MKCAVLLLLASGVQAFVAPRMCLPSGSRKTVSRRELAFQAVTWSSMGLALAAPLEAAVAMAPTVQNVEALGEKAKNLRQALRKEGAKAGPRAVKEAGTILKPLQKDMEAVAGNNRVAKTQALLMKGHLLELDQALKGNDWAPYTSRSTGATYPGGKAERELEEVEETIEEFLRAM